MLNLNCLNIHFPNYALPTKGGIYLIGDQHAATSLDNKIRIEKGSPLAKIEIIIQNN